MALSLGVDWALLAGMRYMDAFTLVLRCDAIVLPQTTLLRGIGQSVILKALCLSVQANAYNAQGTNKILECIVTFCICSCIV
jgi:hypothetical protein